MKFTMYEKERKNEKYRNDPYRAVNLQELLHIGKNTALRLVQSGEIEAFRVGKQWRVSKESVAKYVRRME